MEAHEILCSKTGVESNLPYAVKTAGSYTSLPSSLLGIVEDPCGRVYGAACCVVIFFVYGPVFGTVFFSFS